MKSYVILVGNDQDYFQDYFSGKIYNFQKEPYAALVNINNAKRYKTQKLAEHTAERLWNKTVNCGSRPIIVEVDE